MSLIKKIEEHQDLKEQKENFQPPYPLLNENFKASYFIGLDWLDEETALFVKPKIENLDFLKMFMECFKQAGVANEINKKRNGDHIYKIDTHKKFIEINTKDFEITPFIIIHFLGVLENICKRGLKSGYIRREENLSAKIKGKIMFAQHLKKNISVGRADRVYCNFQDYSVDCPENQLLKKALVFAQRYILKFLSGDDKKETLTEISKKISFCKAFFEGVSDVKNTHSFKNFKVNKLFKDYKEGLELAKLILKRFSYNIQETQQNQNQNKIPKTPPFWINMSLLFEFYTLAKLKEVFRGEIEYQAKGNYGDADFLKTGDEKKIVMDAKYKKDYKNSYHIDDIRQLSGYARDTEILKKLKVDENTVVHCLIIYPKKDGVENFEKGKEFLDTATEIKEFTKFYKIGLQLPTQNQ